MMIEKIFVKILGVVVGLLLLSASSAFAQQFCEADCNGDCLVNLTDVVITKSQHLSPPHPALVEQTGQTTFWGSGDNGQLETGVAWPNPRFTDNRNGTITDNLTGLIWLKDANCAGEVAWADALNVSNELGQGTCGLTDGSSPGDWRLPTRFELASLLTTAYYDPAIPNTAGTGKWTAGDPFVNVQIGYYWTSTTTALNSENAWFVYTQDGHTYHTPKQSVLSVWPVRGGQSTVNLTDLETIKSEFLSKNCDYCSPPYPASVEQTGQTTSWGSGDNGQLETGVAWPNPRFTDNRNGTITDNLTGLIWLKNANCAGELKWADALHVSNVLEHGTCGLTDGSSPGDWRLPTRFELESLLSMAYYDPAIPNTAGTGKWTAGDPFVNVPSYWYWTSTTNAFNSENAWFVNTAEGRIYYDSKQYFLFVWPVRGKQSERRADCNSDLKVDLADLVIMKGEFFKTDCVENPCLADCNGDNKVDLADLVLMKEQFFTVSGQSQASSYEIDVGQDGTFDTGGTINLDNNDSVTIDIYVSGYTCPPNDKLFGSQLYILVDESQVTVSGFPYDTSHAGPFDPGLSVFAWEEKNVYILVSSNFNYVTVIGGKQKLGTVKLTCKAPGSFNLVVANDLTSYGYPASDDGISVDCNLAMIYPKTAVLTVNQGNIPTVFPEDPTVCVVTTCPEEVTVCPETPTECPVDPTFCPADPTFCPVDPTFCPGIPTECPADPTVCVVTECPADPTFCPADPTFCPADPTFCPETPTECPSDPTSCPGIPTECPVDPTVCVATACPVDPTFCPVIPTQCPVPTTTTTQPWYPDCIDFDPDTLNINSRGKWITVYIEPPGYDPAEIDPATILLNGTVSPILDPKYDFVTDKDLYLADVTCEPGVIERMVKFDSGAVAEILSVGEEVEIVVTYGLYDGTLFMGTYVIRVIDR